MAHSLWLSQNTTPVTMESNAIDIINGYPDANDIAATLADSSGFSVSTAVGPPVVTTFARAGAPGTCEVTYSDALAIGNPPIIMVDLTGC